MRDDAMPGNGGRQHTIGIKTSAVAEAKQSRRQANKAYISWLFCVCLILYSTLRTADSRQSTFAACRPNCSNVGGGPVRVPRPL